MSASALGVAVIGAGMAGKAHAAAYRSASSVFEPVLPPVRLVSIADIHEPAARAAAQRFGYSRHDTSWQAIVDADDIDVVSVVVANALHRPIVQALLAAGKHVLCEKPLTDSLDEARAMVAAADASPMVARVGLTYRRSPGPAFIRDLVRNGTLGTVLNFSGHYWTEYGCDPNAPISWRYQGPPGSGALADVGSHLTYLAEFITGSDIRDVRGGLLSTVIASRPVPVGAVVGHEGGEVTSERVAVTNDDVAAYSALFANGASGTLQVSRVAAGHPNTLAFEVFGDRGAAGFDFRNPSVVQLNLADPATDAGRGLSGYRSVILGPEHPYWRGGLAMDAPGVGIGQNEGFVFQARAMLEEVAGIPESDGLPRNASFREGLHNMLIIDAVAASAAGGGVTITVD
ncbi:MAG: Gfo/Idh/MocA family protein [Beutenbergiaceae bacterium]